ncbi:hypothetical protein [Streptomyces sp. AK02-01A]|nr:hypothetical protein [Streptomyces sp. AK02-01A]MDX3854119.1 hypothetical protein [Streptomyces sp. AK02-01A]
MDEHPYVHQRIRCTGFLVARAGAPSRAPVTAVREQLLTAARSW